MLYFATLKDWAWLTPGHARAAPTSNARVWIDGLYIRLLGGGQGGCRPPNSTRAGNVAFIPETVACKPAVRYGRVEFARTPRRGSYAIHEMDDRSAVHVRDRVAGSNATDSDTGEGKEAETLRPSCRGAENRQPGEPGSDHQRLFERDGQRSARL